MGTDADNVVTVYAGEKEVSCTGHSFGVYYLTDAVVEDVVVKEGEDLTIGIRSGAWYKADDFRLFYMGGIESDDLTGIEDVRASRGRLSGNDNAVYDLQGRRIVSPQLLPGVYIVGGKKVMVR